MPTAISPPFPQEATIPSYWRTGKTLFVWGYMGGKGRGKNSQCGQHLAVEILAGATSNRLFLDIGANDGIEMSSTYRLEQRGWRGMLVEPNIQLIESLIKYRTGHIVAAAVSSSDGMSTLYTSETHTLGTLICDPHSFAYRRLAGSDEGNHSIACHPVPTVCMSTLLNSFIGVYGYQPDFLKIDVEGHEIEVVRGLLQTEVRPPIIEIENNERTSLVGELLIESGYYCLVVMEGFVELWFNELVLCNKIKKLFD